MARVIWAMMVRARYTAVHRRLEPPATDT